LLALSLLMRVVVPVYGQFCSMARAHEVLGGAA